MAQAAREQEPSLVPTLFPRHLVLALNNDHPDAILAVSANPAITQHTAFKIKCTDPSRYSVKPVCGYLAPGETVQVGIQLKGKWHPEDQFLVRTCTVSDEARAGLSAHDFWESVKGKTQVDKQILPVTSDDATLRLLAKNASLKTEDRLTDDELAHVRALRDRMSPLDWERMTRLALSSPLTLQAQGDQLEAQGDVKHAAERFTEWAVRSELNRDDAAHASACGRLAGLAMREGRLALAQVWHDTAHALAPESIGAWTGTLASASALKVAADQARDARLAALARLQQSAPGPAAVSVARSPPAAVAANRSGGGGALSALTRQREAQQRHVERAQAARVAASGTPVRSSPAGAGANRLAAEAEGPFHLHVTFEHKTRRLAIADTAARAMEMTVRDMKRLVQVAFDVPLAGDEDVVLAVGGNALTDAWRGADFGLRATTRIDASVGKRHRRPLDRLSVVVVDVETLDAPSASPPPPPPPPPAPVATPATPVAPSSVRDQVRTLEQKIEATESPPSAPMAHKRTTPSPPVQQHRATALLQQQQQQQEQHALKDANARLKRELDAARAEVARLSELCDALAEDKAQLLAKLHGVAVVAAAPPTPPPVASRLDFSTLGTCCVAAPMWMLVPSPEEEDYFEGEEGGVVVLEDDCRVRIGADGEPVAFKAVAKGEHALERLAAFVSDDVVDAALEGASAAVVVWGESAAGKSALMEGLSDEASGKVRPGLMDLVCRRLFASIAASAAEAGQALVNFHVKVSAVQIDIASGALTDLLKPGRSTPRVQSASAAGARVNVEGCSLIECTSTREFEKIIAKVDRPRRMARGTSPRRGDPLADALVCVVTVEIQLPDSTGDRPTSPRFVSFAGRLRFIELPGAERFLDAGEAPTACATVERMLSEAAGRLSMVVVLHPGQAHADKSRSVAQAALRLGETYADRATGN